MSEPDLAAVLPEVWREIHIHRLDGRDGTVRGPDNFYNGCLHGTGVVLKVAEKYGVTAQEVYDGRPGGG